MNEQDVQRLKWGIAHILTMVADELRGQRAEPRSTRSVARDIAMSNDAAAAKQNMRNSIVAHLQSDMGNNPNIGSPLLTGSQSATVERPLIFDVKETAHLLGISTSLVRQLITKRDLASIQVSYRVLVPRTMLESFIEQQLIRA